MSWDHAGEFFRDADDNWLFNKTEIAAELLFVVTFQGFDVPNIASNL